MIVIRMMKRERGNRKIRIVSFILIAMKHAFGDGRTKVILQFFNQVIIHVCMYVERTYTQPDSCHCYRVLLTFLSFSSRSFSYSRSSVRCRKFTFSRYVSLLFVCRSRSSTSSFSLLSFDARARDCRRYIHIYICTCVLRVQRDKA